jgi:hypothetical protein
MRVLPGGGRVGAPDHLVLASLVCDAITNAELHGEEAERGGL